MGVLLVKPCNSHLSHVLLLNFESSCEYVPFVPSIMTQVQVMHLFCLYMTFNFLFFRAKKELHANMAVTHSWSEFNALLDKQKVCAFGGFRFEG